MSTTTPARSPGRRLGLHQPTAPPLPTSAPGGTTAEVSAPPAEFEVTIVVPTRNEAGNVAELLRRLNGALNSIRAEIVFVDDSDDDTPAVILAEAERSLLPVHLVHRPAGDREGRLGGAVVLGFRSARAPWALVIDGDLQHPPEAVPRLVAATRAEGVDLVYGSRYASAGDASGLDGRTRAVVSASSTTLAKALFPSRLRGVSDPMSGFFAVRLGALDLTTLRPPGYKVLLEILAVSRLRETVGVPFSFQPRFSGDSKASVAEGIRYLQQLVALRVGTSVAALTRLTAFLLVGLSGVGVNSAVLWAMSDRWWHQPYLLASLIATNVAVVWNFVLLELFVFRASRKHSPWQGFLRFWWLNMLLLPVQLGLLALLVEGLSLNPVVANVIALTVVFVLRYAATTLWVYERSGRTGPKRNSSPLVEVDALLPAAIVSSAPAAGRWAPAVLRFGVAVAAALVAFPAVAVHCWQLLGGPPRTTVAVAFVLCAAGVSVVLRAAPPPGDADIHDRQLDFILAIPTVAAALFLSFAWPTRFPATGSLGAREVLAFTALLTGAALLLLGTRCTARIRWVLLAPLLLLPVVQQSPVAAAVLIALYGLVLLLPAVGVVGRRAIGRRRPIAPTTLPNARTSLVLVAAVAAILGILALSAPVLPNVAAPVPSAGTR